MKQKCLMLGAGHTPLKRKYVAPTSAPESNTEWVSLDMNPDCKPDILFELELIEKGQQIPVAAESFDEIHAYDVLEHYGTPGDYNGFFMGFRELWRILKPGGLLIANTPMWDVMWTWGDPGHCRVIAQGTLGYLTRAMYYDQETGECILGKSAATDYRRFVDPCWWEVRSAIEKNDTGGFFFALQRVV